MAALIKTPFKPYEPDLCQPTTIKWPYTGFYTETISRAESLRFVSAASLDILGHSGK